jgi:hypothetical protein
VTPGWAEQRGREQAIRDREVHATSKKLAAVSKDREWCESQGRKAEGYGRDPETFPDVTADVRAIKRMSKFLADGM